MPTVAGWYHEIGYRGREAYQGRVNDVETIYTGSTEQQVALLQQYDVEYIYYGPAERNNYDRPTIGNLVQDHEAVTVVHQSGGNDGTFVIRVDQSRL